MRLRAPLHRVLSDMIRHSSAPRWHFPLLPGTSNSVHIATMAWPVKSDIVSVYQGGAFFGSLSAYVASYYWGRKSSLYIFVVPFLIGGAMNCGAINGNSLGLVIGGRVLTGWGVGGCSSIAPIYLSELSPPAIRGRLVGSWEIGWQIGGVVGFWINYGVDQTTSIP